MEQRMSAYVRRPPEWRLALAQRRVADGKEFGMSEKHHAPYRMFGTAIGDGEIGLIGDLRMAPVIGHDMDGDIGMKREELAEPRDKPVGRKARHAGRRDLAFDLTILDRARDARQPLEGIVDGGEQLFAGLGEQDGSAPAVKEWRLELGLEAADLMRDGTVSH
jgi:hypothetical protein